MASPARLARGPRWGLAVAVGTVVLATSAQAATTDRVGPLATVATGRAKVRGDRPEGSGPGTAWVPPAVDPAAGDREALEAFEAAAFLAPRTAVVDTPPVHWMRQLTTPELAVRWNDKTVEYLRFFKESDRGRAMMRAWMRRYGRYHGLIRRVFAEVGVPADLAMVALAESGFNPRVRSRVGAGGLWQFMDATARIYGLRVDFWVDDRFDPELSTFAAAAYLKDLRTRFGSWELALAAYNAGYGLVMTAVDRHNTNNFWALTEIESGLPHDTTNYVPKIFAAAIVAANRDAFGVDAATVRSLPAAEWVDVEVGGATALAEVAKLLQVDPELFGELNARYLRGRTPPGTKSRLHVPREASGRWPAVARVLSPGWDDERIHVMREGERLAAVAMRHGTTEKQLRSLNGIADTAELRAGVPLLVPRGSSAGGEAPTADLPLAAVPPVHPGPGQRLVFLEATRATTATSLTRAFAIPWDHLVLWNDLDPSARLQDGQVLQVLVPEGFDADAAGVKILEPAAVEHVVRGSREHLEASLRRRGLVRRGYEVRAGDTLERISRHLDLSVGDLARINGFDRTHTPAGGDLLVVYVPEGRTRGTTEAPPPTPVYPVPDAPTPPADPTAQPPNVTTSTAPAEAPPPDDARPRRRRVRKGGSRTPSDAVSSRVPGRSADPEAGPPGMR